jgi:hypothetical protein
MLESKMKILLEYFKINEKLKFLKVIIELLQLGKVMEKEMLKEFFIVK